MDRRGFKQLKKDADTLRELDRVCTKILEDEERQASAVREACRLMLLKGAQASLKNVPVEELAQSKAGIRVSALADAGYPDLLALDSAPDWELRAVEGVGEKQVESIRRLITEFKNHLADYTSLRLSAEDKSSENLTMILSLARYKNGLAVRQDLRSPASSLKLFSESVLARILVNNRIKWLFAGTPARESTAGAAEEMRGFLESEAYERICRLIAAYDDAINTDMPTAMKDFENNAAAYYALIEKTGAARIKNPVIYSSIPAQLAAEIDGTELDLTDFKGNLRSYQAFGTKYILHQGRVLLGDEMGLGKTVQAIAAMVHIEAKTHEAFNRAVRGEVAGETAGFPAELPCHYLVICPASVLVNWCREIKKFSTIEAHLIHGPYLEENFKKWQSEGGAAVTNYESMGRIVKRIDNVMRLKLLVIDEAHYIKNPDALRTKYIRRLDNESERILMMTGTPLENRVEEMCSLIDFIQPEMAVKVRQAAYMSRVPEFRQMVAPVYLRRVREDVLEELPPIAQSEEWCVPTEDDLKAYSQKVWERQFAAMRRVSFLQDNLGTSAKAQRLLEICREAGSEGRKILVYSFFRETVEKVSRLLGASCIGTITGATEIQARQALIDRLAEAPAGSVIAAQIQAGGTGLNIQAASVVIFCEPQIKPSLTMQALSRVYRMGQVRNVLVFHLLCPDTVDEAILKILSTKQIEFDNYADESTMAEATEELVDSEWIRKFLEEESRRYLPMVVEQV